MALFKSGNPTLRETAFQGTILQGITTGEEMTIRGTMNKFGFLFLMMMGTCFFAWSNFYKGGNPMPLMLIGVLGGISFSSYHGVQKTMVALARTCFCFIGRIICRISFCVL